MAAKKRKVADTVIVQLPGADPQEIIKGDMTDEAWAALQEGLAAVYARFERALARGVKRRGLVRATG